MFPPKRKTKEVQEALPDGHGVLIFFATTPPEEKLYAFLITNDKKKYPHWQVRNLSALKRKARQMLREMGNINDRRAVSVKELQESDWKKSAGSVYTELFSSWKRTKESLPRDLEELVIVPDSMLWYLPFDALLSGTGEQKKPLLSKLRIRYAPTMSLAVPDGRGRRINGNTAVHVGRLFPGLGESERTKAASQELRDAIAGAVELPQILPAPTSIYSTLFDRLIVLNDIENKANSPFGWKPISANRGPSDTLDSWLPLPWGGPDQVMLPGYHTAAEHAMSVKEPNLGGADVFLSVCGMMATGTRTILLSRWRTGGRTSIDLVREFAQELPYTTASKAWQRSVFLCTETPLKPDLEPRLTATQRDNPGMADHPFFWSGYMLVDTGVLPPNTAAKVPPKLQRAAKAAAVRFANRVPGR